MLSPLLPFVVFHMAIGTIMVATRTMWYVATGVCLLAGAIYSFEQTGVLARPPSQPLDSQFAVNLLMMVVLTTVARAASLARAARVESLAQASPRQARVESPEVVRVWSSQLLARTVVARPQTGRHLPMKSRCSGNRLTPPWI